MASPTRSVKEIAKQPSQPKALVVTECGIGDLQPDPRNPRIASQRQLKLLAESIKAFGFIVPVLTDAQKRVLTGHARLAAARQLGMRVVPTICLEHLTAEQARAFQIADNRLTELATWNDRLLAEQLKGLAAVDLDFNIEATGFTVGEIDLRIEGLDDAVTEADCADVIPEVEGFPVTALGDIWTLNDHRLYCGSAIDGASYSALMADSKAAAVFADPPYNVAIDGFVGGKGKIRHREFAMGVGEMSPAEFEHFLATAFHHLAHHSIDGALHYICIDWRHLPEILGAGHRCYTELKNLCVWTKGRAGMGSFYRSQHELVTVYKSGKGKARNNIELGRNGRHRSNVWKYPSVLNSRHGEEGDLLALHPTVKPLRLVADAILDSTARGDIVLDSFLGSGTTLMACQRVGRVCHGMELDPLHVDVAIRRWQRDTGQEAIHAVTGRTFADHEREAVAKQNAAISATPMADKESGHG